jgi:hypothetical protein
MKLRIIFIFFLFYQTANAQLKDSIFLNKSTFEVFNFSEITKEQNFWIDNGLISKKYKRWIDYDQNIINQEYANLCNQWHNINSKKFLPIKTNDKPTLIMSLLQSNEQVIRKKTTHSNETDISDYIQTVSLNYTKNEICHDLITNKKILGFSSENGSYIETWYLTEKGVAYEIWMGFRSSPAHDKAQKSTPSSTYQKYVGATVMSSSDHDRAYCTVVFIEYESSKNITLDQWVIYRRRPKEDYIRIRSTVEKKYKELVQQSKSFGI